MNPLCVLGTLGVLWGAAATGAFRRAADGPAVRALLNQIQAHLLEFWIFVDEPRAIWKSWKGLMAANARLLRLLVAPLAIISLATLPLFIFLDACYGSLPLAVGKPALVTLGFDRPLEGMLLPELRAPDGIAVESPAVRVFSERQVSWRIRPLRPFSGELHWTVGGRELRKSVTAGGGFRFHSSRRTRSVLELVRYPTEAPLAADLVEWIEISYAPTTVANFGIEAHWSVWFVAFSLPGVLAASRSGGSAR